ncbi:lectin-like protein [Pontiella sulfatireligans]|uniref:C-type lectin domain-containing protein n=1 Tax=Pontiella sulfatireligans TaxID=2750658 RepID=A0A6C2UIC7_9BACT|nr:lectin-like protein [Pontiella sulfatireligans]VGO19955.1 hypothetical protein SCARR_02015 [Pontiella sulfatireligans]
MKTIVAIITLNAATAIAATAGTSDYAYCPHNEHYYKAVHVPEGISWSQAKAEAEKDGGYLATITSENENKFVFRLVNSDRFWTPIGGFDNFGPWLGGYQGKGAREPDSGWRWVTGEDFFFASWAPMEPSGRWKGKDENCLQFYCKGGARFGKWNDTIEIPDDIPVRGYIIEKGETQTEPRETLVTEPLLEVHEFTGANGKSCRGRVITYNANNDTVTIEKENKHTCKVDLAHLSANDQAYVREWHLIKEFCTPNRIRISAKEKKCAEDREMAVHDNQGNNFAQQTMESIGYEVFLENRIGADLPDVELEYCIYYEQDRPSYANKMSVGQGVKCGTLDIGTLAERAKTQIDTEPVILLKRQQEYGPNNELRGEVHGVWIRLYLPLANGSRAMREYASPKNISRNKQWATTDVSVLKPNFLRQSMGRNR